MRAKSSPNLGSNYMYMRLLILMLLVLIPYFSYAGHPLDRACSDFNQLLYPAVQSGIHYFKCPDDGVANVACQESYPSKPNLNASVPARVTLKDTLIYVLLGPRSKTDAFRWWLPLITEKIDIVLVLDACEESGVKSANSTIRLVHKDPLDEGESLGPIMPCDAFVREMINALPATVKRLVNFHIVHVRPEDELYSKLSCKLSTAMSEIYKAFPEKRYYFKIDTDTIVFPGRLLHFLSSLESVHVGGVADDVMPSKSTHPIYFGTAVESGMDLLLCGDHRGSHKAWTRYGNADKGGLCYAQGGAGYGLNNKAMSAMAQAPSCSDPSRVTVDGFLANEDAWAGMQMYKFFNISLIHCGGFSSSELAPDRKLRQSITFHYIDANWLKSYGETALKYYTKGYLRHDTDAHGSRYLGA